jgi:hypothetical protein
VDGADTRYGQLYKPISAHPFKEAIIKGFSPIQPFKVSQQALAQTDQCAAFHWPSLSELNDKIAPFAWDNDTEYERYMSGDSITKLPIFTTGPPPATPNHPIPTIPAIQLSWQPSSRAQIASSSSLTILAPMMHKNGVWLGLLLMILFQFTPLTLDGGFFFEFYICHPADWRYNAVNQCYWIQFHGREDIIHPSLSTDTHLVHSSKTSDDYAKCHHLLPFWNWLNITHHETYIHGPFEFASVRGRKTRDRICQTNSNILQKHTSMLQTPYQ